MKQHDKTRYRLLQMLIVLTGASFLLSTSGLALTPFLQIIADDLRTTLAAVANFISFTAVSWGIASLIAGAASDRIGRRPILILSVLAMGCAQFGIGSSHSYTAIMLWMILAGVGGGSFTGTVYATVSDHMPSQQRGRALSWIMTGQSLSLVFGVPLIALLGAFGGWRGALMTYGVITGTVALIVRIAVPPDPPRSSSQAAAGDTRSTLMRAIKRLDILVLLGASAMERVCFTVIAVYMAAYLQSSYGVSLSQLAFSLAIVALGTVSGNMLGGYIADFFPARMLLYACSASLTALLVLPLMLWQPGLTLSLALGFAYFFTNSLGRPSLLSALSEVPSEVRGAIMGINVTTASIGWLTAAALGGWLVTHIGFYSLAVLCLFAGLLGSGFGFTHWRYFHHRLNQKAR